MYTKYRRNRVRNIGVINKWGIIIVVVNSKIRRHISTRKTHRRSQRSRGRDRKRRAYPNKTLDLFNLYQKQ